MGQIKLTAQHAHNTGLSHLMMGIFMFGTESRRLINAVELCSESRRSVSTVDHEDSHQTRIYQVKVTIIMS